MEASKAENRDPTPQEMMAVAEKAQKTAEEAKTAAEARRDVAAEVQVEGEKQGFDITEEQAQMIADVFIANLEARGAFPEDQSPNEPPTPPPPGTEAPEVEGSPAPQPAPPAGAQPPAPGGEGAEPPAPTPGPDQEPRPKSLAERFQRRHR
jgi:hypothetical protein